MTAILAAIIEALPADVRQAIEDGLALARLMEARDYPDGWLLVAVRADGSADVEAHFATTFDRSGPTIAAACDAAREALEPDDG